MRSPLISILISTYNRRATVLDTLGRLRASSETAVDVEIIVVDNASRDGTADSITASFPEVRLLRSDVNRGACAKNDGLAVARGDYVLFLDDDSFPTPGSLDRMVRIFEQDRSLGATIFMVVLPDGSQECSAYPDVCIGCGTGFRTDALRQVGGLPDDFFMQAEEYDLSLRLLDAGWGIDRFESLSVRHLKTPGARVPTRTTRLDVRNNLTLAARRFPKDWAVRFAVAWWRRYAWIASGKGWRHLAAFGLGTLEGVARALRPGRRRPISDDAFEQFAKIRLIEDKLRDRVGTIETPSILLVDAGKNLLAFCIAAERAGIHVVAIADDRLASPGRRFRGIPIIADAEARRLTYDLAVIANVSPVHAAQRRAQWYVKDSRPVIDLLELPPTTVDQSRFISKAA